MKKKELVYNNFLNKNLFAVRISNNTIIVDKKKLPDSDQMFLECKNGYCYMRNITLETYIESKYYIFCMI